MDFQYPLDTKNLIRKKNRLVKQLKQERDVFLNIKIAILGGSTVNEVVDQMNLFLLNYGIEAEFYVADYGLYWEEAVFENKKLDLFQPDIIYIFTSWRNILEIPGIQDSKEYIDTLLDNNFKRFLSMWESLERKYKCPIIQNNFDRPYYRVLGNRDIWDMHGLSNFVSRLNQKFYLFAQENSNFYINDLEYLSQDYGLSNWNDETSWCAYKYACAIDAIPYIGQSVANIIKSIYGKNKKLLMLDLDNTIWGGIIGEDDVENIKIGMDSPEGEAYYNFQKYCKSLKEMGVLLAVNSKNDIENAIRGLSDDRCLLSEQDFVSMKVNWESKADNIRKLAQEINIGVDSMVFIDDNPAERDLVSVQCGDIVVPDIQGVDKYIKILDHCGYFEATTLSDEDLNKTEIYNANFNSNKECNLFSDYGAYLENLEMVAYISGFKKESYSRVAQLVNKTNQFNLTNIRYTESDISEFSESNNYISIACRLKDKFIDNGIVSAIIGEVINEELHIKLWVMSCRVFQRGLEDVLMNALISAASDQNISVVYGYYNKTEKNHMVADLYEKMGFELIVENEKGDSRWKIQPLDYHPRKVYIKVTENC